MTPEVENLVLQTIQKNLFGVKTNLDEEGPVLNFKELSEGIKASIFYNLSHILVLSINIESESEFKNIKLGTSLTDAIQKNEGNKLLIKAKDIFELVKNVLKGIVEFDEDMCCLSGYHDPGKLKFGFVATEKENKDIYIYKIE